MSLRCGIVAFACLFSVAAYGHGARPACPAVAHADELLTPGAHVMVGEMHGTRETPAVVAALACRAAARGPVRVALEMPESEAAPIAAYLAGKGSAAERKALVASSFWTAPFQDGRRSQAMVDLVESLRQLRRGGADVGVVTFDASDKDRDRAMAERLRAAVAREPNATFVALVGNLHARKTPGRFKRTFMAASLVDAGVVFTTLDARYSAGTSWVCLGNKPENCGPSAIGKGARGQLAIELVRATDGAYDGTIDVGGTTFSPPAAVAMTDAQKAKIHLAEERSAAGVAYDGKKFADCASAFLDLAAHDNMPGDDDYSAACCLAQAGQADRAFGALEDAASHGFNDAAWLEQDHDLAPLHADARWTPLVAKLRARTATAKH